MSGKEKQGLHIYLLNVSVLAEMAGKKVLVSPSEKNFKHKTEGSDKQSTKVKEGACQTGGKGNEPAETECPICLSTQVDEGMGSTSFHSLPSYSGILLSKGLSGSEIHGIFSKVLLSFISLGSPQIVATLVLGQEIFQGYL